MQEITSKDIRFMRRALELARRGQGCVHPNPLVGAVLVKNGRVIGEGWHEKFGGPHAEVRAVQNSRADVRGATLYATLEPCSHLKKKTPPCTGFILKKGIRRVVVASEDFNPAVNGRGLVKLRKAGVEIRAGVLKREALELNRDFNHWVRRGTSYGILKFARSLDGKITAGPGQPRWISGPASRRLVQDLRASCDAVLVGVRTVLADDPYLSVRNGAEKKKGFRMPFKVVLDSQLRTPLSANIFSKKSPGPVILAASRRAPRARIAQCRKKAEVWLLPEKGGYVDLKTLFKKLAGRGIVSVLIEGGAEVIADALHRRVAQELYCFTAPKLIQSGVTVKAPAVRSKKIRRIGSDWLIHGRLA